MKVQSGRRGYFYQCKNPDCGHTINGHSEWGEGDNRDLQPIIALPFHPVAI